MLRSVGPTTSVNRKTVSNGTFMQIVLFLVTAAVVIWVNFWYGASCNTTFDERELEAEIDSLNRRILLAESTNTKNNLHMEKLLHKLERSLSVMEHNELNRLEELSQEESVKISLLLASQHVLKISEFQLNSNDIEQISDVVDVVLGQSQEDLNSVYLNDNANGGGVEEFVAEVSDADAHKQCTEWKNTYNVDVGINWGTLPYDLQDKWLAMECDYHLDS